MRFASIWLAFDCACAELVVMFGTYCTAVLYCTTSVAQISRHVCAPVLGNTLTELHGLSLSDEHRAATVRTPIIRSFDSVALIWGCNWIRCGDKTPHVNLTSCQPRVMQPHSEQLLLVFSLRFDHRLTVKLSGVVNDR